MSRGVRRISIKVGDPGEDKLSEKSGKFKYFSAFQNWWLKKVVSVPKNEPLSLSNEDISKRDPLSVGDFSLKTL